MVLNGLYQNTLPIEKILREITLYAKLTTVFSVYNLSRLRGPIEKFQENYIPEEIEEKLKQQSGLRIDTEIASATSMSPLASPNSTSWVQKQQLETGQNWMQAVDIQDGETELPF